MNEKQENNDLILLNLSNYFESENNSFNKNINYFTDYCDFLQKYINLINNLYRTLTELNNSFPKLSGDILDNSLVLIRGSIKSIVKAKLTSLIYFLSETQTIIHTLEKSIESLKNNLSEIKLSKENVESNIKELNIKYINFYNTLMTSFKKIEDKTIENYYKKNYFNDQATENIDDLNSLIKTTKDLEYLFINFDKNNFSNYIDEYGNSISNLDNINNQLKFKFKEFMIGFMNNFKIFYNNCLANLDKEINSLNEINISPETIYQDYLKNKDSEKNKILTKILSLKKYELNIINKNLIKIENLHIDQNKIQNIPKNGLIGYKEIVISDEDKYNIIKEIYNCDFEMMNKTTYDLKIEEEKKTVKELTFKLLLYDPYKNIDRENINKDEIEKLNNMIKTKDNGDYLIKFLTVLNNYRSKGQFEITENQFDIIINILRYSLDYLGKNKNEDICELTLILSQTFYKMKDGKKVYLSEIVKDHPLIQSINFWNDYIYDQIETEFKKHNLNRKEMGITEEMNKTMNDEVIFSKTISLINNMKNFKFECKDIMKIIDGILDKYEVEESKKNIILNVLGQIRAH